MESDLPVKYKSLTVLEIAFINRGQPPHSGDIPLFFYTLEYDEKI